MVVAPRRQQAADRVGEIGVDDEKEEVVYCGSW
ncbi:hypothetical protein L195_g036729, partial [Trifolium pratense]